MPFLKLTANEVLRRKWWRNPERGPGGRPEGQKRWVPSHPFLHPATPLLLSPHLALFVPQLFKLLESNLASHFGTVELKQEFSPFPSFSFGDAPGEKIQLWLALKEKLYRRKNTTHLFDTKGPGRNSSTFSEWCIIENIGIVFIHFWNFHLFLVWQIS